MRTTVLILLLLALAVPASAQVGCDRACREARERQQRDRDTYRDSLADQQRATRELRVLQQERARDRAVDVTNEVIRSRPFIDPPGASTRP